MAPPEKRWDGYGAPPRFTADMRALRRDVPGLTYPTLAHQANYAANVLYEIAMGRRPGLAVHRTIVVVDVAGFGDRHRTSVHRVAIRAGLYQVLWQAFERAGISWASCDCEDRGDGAFVLAPAETPKALFVEALPHALVTALREHNTTHSNEARIRLRMALHAGEVTYDQHGVTANAVNLAFRLLDAGPLKSALAESPGVLAIITSGWFFEEVVRQSPACDATTYRPVHVTVKETSTIAWISRPDHG